jgi:L-amino acid N-acyltransferase YncA
MQIRPALPTDAPGIWEIIRPVIRAGDTYALDPCLTETEAIALWLSPDRETYVAEEAGVLVGTYYMRSNYYLRPNYLRPDDAAAGNYNRHVCNCGYISAARGVGRAMAEHSLREARDQGYRAMQFNLVASTNSRAIKLWHWLGFETIATLPGAFLHPVQGYVDAFVMYRTL